MSARGLGPFPRPSRDFRLARVGIGESSRRSSSSVGCARATRFIVRDGIAERKGASLAREMGRRDNGDIVRE